MIGEVQRLVLTACLQREPAVWLAQALADAAPRLTAAELAALRALVADPRAADGMRLSRLVVQKLRLERLLRGDRAAAAAFAADPAAFVARFQRYLAAVPPTAVFPSEEAAAFAAFVRDDACG